MYINYLIDTLINLYVINLLYQTNAQSAGLRSWEMQQRAMQQREMQLRGMHHCLSKQH